MDITPLYTRIWLGSAPSVGPALAKAGFHTLVLCAREYQPPGQAFPGLQVLHAPMDDNDEAWNFDIALQAAERVKREWTRGRVVLITCRMGRNRSALVAALAIFLITGLPMSHIIDHIRSVRRDPLGVPALSNAAFVAFLQRVGWSAGFAA